MMYTLNLPPVSEWPYKDNFLEDRPVRECYWIQDTPDGQVSVVVTCRMIERRRTFKVERADLHTKCPLCGGWGYMQAIDPKSVILNVEGGELTVG